MALFAVHRAPGTRSRLRRLLVVAAVVAVCVGAGVLWHKVVKDHFIIRNFGVVEEGKVYRSGRLTAGTLTKAHGEYGVKTVIDLGAYPDGSDRDVSEEETARRLGMKRVKLRLYGDGTGNPNAYVEALRIMRDPASQPVLVHCSAGAERTGVAVMLYRNLLEGVPIEKGYDEAQRYKHDPRRNKTMLPYVQRWREKIISAVEKGELIEGVPPARSDTPASSPDLPTGAGE